MTHVVTGRCVDCRYTDCCTVCPVECFYEVTDLAMLVIDPDTCIDCELCVPECPINAVYPESELPDCYADWTERTPRSLSRERFFPRKKTLWMRLWILTRSRRRRKPKDSA